MIASIKIVNFRNFKEKEVFFSENKNFIVGNNGIGKTNILEALSLLGGNSITGLNFDSLTNNSSKYFFIEVKNQTGKTASISYDKSINKKKYLIDGKATSKTKFTSSSYSCVSFSPIIMNMMYLSPSLRREFLDTILKNSYPEYGKILKEYKNIVKNRNKLLKNINEGKSEKREINYWDNLFISKAEEIYKYRLKLISFFEENIGEFLKVFNGKINTISFKYISKIENNSIKKSIKDYLDKNLERDIIVKKTLIGPHIDDFDILIDNVSIADFASRGETKSIILGLKKLEVEFIEKATQKKPVLIIDDLLSELDYEHEKMLLNKLDGYQTFITSIKEEENFSNIIKL